MPRRVLDELGRFKQIYYLLYKLIKFKLNNMLYLKKVRVLGTK